jgi:putative tricarboxylic transport membrane protein
MAHSRIAVCLRDGVRVFWAVALIMFVNVGFWSGTALSLDWKPERNIELIVGTGPGSGVDNTARTLQSVMQNNKMIDQSISVLNKPGGGYGMALNYLGQFPGDGHRLLIQTATPLTSLVAGQLKINYFDLTPIAGLISEPIALMVPTESPIKNGQDLAKRIKADPASVSISLANARGNAYHIACALFARRLGADGKKLKVIVYASSGEAMTALLGRHVDVASVTPGAFLSMVEANKVRILGVASPKRLAGILANVPTFKEQGIDVVIDSPRSIIGPKGLSDDQVRYWNSLFQRIVKTDMWKQALERNQWEDSYMNSAELGKELKSQYNMIKESMIELGMAAK